MKRKTLVSILLSVTFLCTACSTNGMDIPQTPDSSTDAGTNHSAPQAAASDNISLSANPDDYFSDRDYHSSYDNASAVVIYLKNNTAECASNAVQINGDTITITDEGTYILCGNLNNGMLMVNADKSDKIQLVLENATISCENNAPIYIKQADKVFLTLASDSENALSNGGTFTTIDENNIDAVIFSKEDLTLNGSGTLSISSPAGHGIVSKDELTITDGTYTLNTASHGLSGKDNISIANAFFSITSGKDGIHAEHSEDTSLGFVYIDSGSFQITSEGDGISSSGEMLIQDGTFDIIAGGGSENATQQTSDFWGVMPGGGFGGGPGGDFGGPGGDFGGDFGSNHGGGHDSSDGSKGNFNGGRGSKDGFSGMEPPDNMPLPDAQNNESSTTDSTSIKGIKASGNLQINNGTFTIDAADDSIHSNANLLVKGGAYSLKTGDDGFHADAALTIYDGNISISESYEGLEGLCLDIYGGNISLVASDDGLNAAGGTDQSGMGGPRGGDMFATDENSYINIAGGTLYIKASGDGMDSNGYLTISNGSVVISGPNFGDTAILDYGIEATINGGTFIGIGATQMSANFSDSSTQGALLVSTGNQKAGTAVELADAAGQILLSQTADQDFSGILLSCPSLQQSKNYTLTIGSDATDFTMKKLIYSARLK